MTDKKISLIFIGSAAIGAPLLEALAQDERFEVRLVITQQDRPAGRKLELTMPAIKAKGKELGLKIEQPADINDPRFLSQLKKNPPDLIVLMAYGQILKKELLSLPRLGCINVHASLLPRYRGASPLQQCLLEQDKQTGISIMRMTEKMDAGPVYETFTIPFSAEDNALTLTEKIADLTARKTPGVLADIAGNRLTPRPQEESAATYCAKIKKTDGLISWNEDAETISAKIRAYAGWPGTYTFFKGKRLKILSGTAIGHEGGEPAGTVIKKDHRIMVKTKKGALLLGEVQLEGKKPQAILEFVKGCPELLQKNLSLA